MIEPKREDVKCFDTYSVKEFALWLRLGLEGYFLEDQDVWAFEPLAVFIGQEDDLFLDLRNIYNALSPTKKTSFRQAVADILADLDAKKENEILFEQLLYLAGVLPAKSEVLRALCARVGNGYFGLIKSSGGVSLFQTTLLIVAELAIEMDEAVTCLNALIKSDNFDNAYAGIALEALCRADAKNLPDHMELLREPLNAMFKQYETGAGAKRLLAKKIMSIVGKDCLEKALAKLRIIWQPSQRDIVNDTWLAEALLIGHPPLMDTSTCYAHLLKCKLKEPSHPEFVKVISGDPQSCIKPINAYGRSLSTQEIIDMTNTNFKCCFNKDLRTDSTPSLRVDR